MVDPLDLGSGSCDVSVYRAARRDECWRVIRWNARDVSFSGCNNSSKWRPSIISWEILDDVFVVSVAHLNYLRSARAGQNGCRCFTSFGSLNDFNLANDSLGELGTFGFGHERFETIDILLLFFLLFFIAHTLVKK